MAFGGVVKLEGETQYRRALAQIMQSYKELQSELKLVTSQFDKNDKSQDALKAKTEAMTKLLDQQKAKLDLLNDRYAELTRLSEQQRASIQSLTDKYRSEVSVLEDLEKSVGKTSNEYKAQETVVRNLENQLDKEQKANQDTEKAMSQLRTEMNNTKTEANGTAREMDNLGKETEESGKQAEQASGGYTILKGVIANLASEAIQKAIEGAKTLATKLIDVGKQSYAAFAEYEQLVGGVETLYGASADRLQKYAMEAYKTSGISANKYMEQATSFAATLLQGLDGDTEKAVDYADLAIRDMADNANKMGTNISMIQNAYQGFAKDNYTMLDNLKLGYGGTASEMARLVNEMKVLGLDEAGELITVDAQTVKNVGLDKIIEAIHLVQQELGITGTTAKEAEGTITGSMGQARAAFENLLVGFGDSKQDVRALTDTLAKTIETMVKNAIPRIKQIVKGMWTSIKTALRTYMPELANSIIPTLEKIGKAIKDLFSFIAKNGDTIIAIVKGLVAAFLTFKVAGLIQSAATALAGLLSMTNPVGLLVTAIAGLVGVFVALNSESDKLSAEDEKRIAEAKEMTEKANDAAQAWDNLKRAQKEYVDNGLSEEQYYENLWEELKKITDENGKIKEGYESRAKYITEQLGKVYGVEINIVGGVIQKYEELRQKMADVMQQRRAEIILKGQEELWKNAVEKQAEYGTEFENARIKYEEAQKELEKTNARWEEVQIALNKGTSDKTTAEFNALRKESKELVSQRASWLEQYGQADATMKKYGALLDEGLYYITNYEKNMELMQEGHYNQIRTLQWEYIRDAKDLDEAQKQQLQTQYNVEMGLRKRAQEMREKYQDEAYKSQEEAHRMQAESRAEQLKELGIYVDEVVGLYGVLSGATAGVSDLAFSAKGEAIQGILNRNEELTPQSIAQAISGMEIVLDDEQVGRFVTKTVTRQVYATAR